MILEPQSKFTIDELESLVKTRTDSKPKQKLKLRLSSRAQNRVKKARKQLEKLQDSDRAIYGLNTGFGRLAKIKVSKAELDQLQVNLLRSHACGVGAPLSRRVVHRLALLRTLSLGKAASGLSLATLQRHLDYYNHDLTPFVPEKGSVGASGDLAPLSHFALTFLGEGEFLVGERRVAALSVLKKNKLAPLQIKAKEGLSLTNGTQVSLSLALEAYHRLKHLWDWSLAVTCLSVEAHAATPRVYDPRIHRLKAHREQQEIAGFLWKALKDSPHGRSHRDCDHVQDSYSFRAVPQILAPCLKLMRTAAELLEGEINSVSDNPIFVSGSAELHSCGHFHAQTVSMAADLLTQAAVTMGNLSERRLDQLVNPLTSRHSAFFAQQPGVESGLMIVQTAAAALASENKTLAFPASADTVSTNGNQEDHVSMGPWAARKALLVLENLESLIAYEAVAAIRGCQLSRAKSGVGFSSFVEEQMSGLSEHCSVAFREGDQIFARAVESIKTFIQKTACR